MPTERERAMIATEASRRVRAERALLHRLVREGKVDVTAILSEPPDITRRVTVYNLLRWQHQWGRSRALKALRVAGVTASATVADVTPRQAGALAAHLLESRHESR